MHVLDEVTLVLGGSVDGRTSGGLGLGAATSGEVGTSEDAAEDGHRELDRNRKVNGLFFVWWLPSGAASWSQKG